MTRLKKIFSVFLFLALTSCASGRPGAPEFQDMNGYIGMNESQIINIWGVPDKVYTLNPHEKVIAYERSRIREERFGVSTCMGSFPGHFGYGGCFDPMPSKFVRMSCEYSFNIVNGTARRWFQNGNDCIQRTR